MTTALVSVLSSRPVRRDIAMTGEITLRGKVLPIGGLKEKSLAARRLGIKTVIIPDGNKREIAELPDVVKQDVTFIPVKWVDEVFDLLLEGGANYEAYKTAQPKPTKKRVAKSKTLPVPKTEDRDSVRC